MRVALIAEEKMLPIPSSIKVLDNWENVLVVDDDGKHLADGDHVHLEGGQQSFIDWLKPFDAVWITKPGTPVMAQQFEAVHIAE